MADLPLYKLIIQDLLEQIFGGSLRPGDRIPSEHELCSIYMVSSITAKNALADLAGKGYIVRQKGKGSFVNTEEQLLQIPDYANTISKRNTFQSKTLGLIVPSMKTGIDQILLDQLESEISKTDYLLTLVITREDQKQETSAIEKLKAQGASGLIIFPTEHEIYNESILRLNLEKYPFVLVDRYLKGIRTNTVCSNNYEITKEAVSYQIEQGCRDIVFLSPDSRNTVTEERFTGFRDTLLAHDIIISSHNTCLIPQDIHDSDIKKEKITHFLEENPSIDGIFCANKEMASYVSRILNKNRSWDKYTVCTFDYTSNPNIAYIYQDVTAIAKNCVSLLLDTIHGSTQPVQIRVPAEFHPAE